jgi:choline dehydrogenase-like flavoprotein
MILDAGTADRAAFAEPFDVCIVGAGPAGITLARRLAAAGGTAALMEGGDRDVSSESQDLYAGRTFGLDYFPLDVARLRFLGGSSNHWAGACRELDAHDLEPRPHHSWSGWPIGREDLDPYQEEVARILGMDGVGFPDQPLRRDSDEFRRILYRDLRPPLRFGEAFHDEIAESDAIRLALNANLVDLRLDDALGTVKEARFRSLEADDPGFAVRARAYVLCAGGIENPRILLNARSQMPTGIGNQHDLVGRFFCEHPYMWVGEVVFEDRFFETEYHAPTAEFLDAYEVLNFNLQLLADRPRSLPPLSLPKEVAREAVCVAPFTERLARRVVGNTLSCADDLGLRAYFARREMPEDFSGRAAIQFEQALDPSNRVRLGPERDALGLQRVVLDWRLHDLDRRTMRTAVLHFGKLLADQGIGRVRVADWILDDDWRAGNAAGEVSGSYHHMCTTRMSDDPRRGVVDRDCRVHGTSNLFVGGSSVFATAGHATPTYTILQLALRLGDHLDGTLLG